MKKISTLLFVVALIALGVVLYWGSGNGPVDSGDKSQKVFVIEKGEAVREIGNSLKKDGLIKDPVVFFVYIKLYSQDKQVQAGNYKLSPSMSLAKIVDTINHGTLDLWVTVPEGLRAEEVASVLKKNIPSYDDSWRGKLDLNEGYLFPDTYSISRDATADQVISVMRSNFNNKISQIGLSQSDPKLNDIVTIASIIQREASFADDMPIVASVIYNRLGIGMKLDVDPSVSYALGYQAATKSWWKAELTFDDLEVVSPYNTYQNAGLPPTPIDNPGIVAIKAAMNPAKTDYLYYISDKQGHIHGAKTLQEHNANIKKYL